MDKKDNIEDLADGTYMRVVVNSKLPAFDFLTHNKQSDKQCRHIGSQTGQGTVLSKYFNQYFQLPQL